MELGLLTSSIYMRNRHEIEGPNVKNVLGFVLMEARLIVKNIPKTK